MSNVSYLTHHFLIAMPGLNDPNFFQTVTYIGEHNEEGALGIVINRPLNVTLGHLFDHLHITYVTDKAATPIYAGGPVQSQQGFVLHSLQGTWGATLRINEQMGITTSQDILQAIAQGEGPDQVMVALGYAGWGPGQLEAEMARNAWLSAPAQLDIIFQIPSSERWAAAAALLGIDLRLLSSQAGHG